MSYSILFLDINNYYNRKIIKYDTLLEYQTAANNYTIATERNFVEADGISTKMTCAWTNAWRPNYIVVFDTNTIISRWWVDSFDFVRGNQYIARLLRDLISDDYENIIEAPVYIEKATIRDIYDPAVYNKEDLLLNQIKKDETLLKDESGVAWLVGFFDSSMTDTEFQDLFKDGDSAYKYINYGKAPDYTTADISTWKPEINNVTHTYICDENEDYFQILTALKFAGTGGYASYRNVKINYNLGSTFIKDEFTAQYVSAGYSWNGTTTEPSNINNAIFALGTTSLISSLMNYGPVSFDDDTREYIDTYSGKVVYDSTTQKYYEVRVTYNSSVTGTNSVINTSALGVAFNNILTSYDITPVTNSMINIAYKLSSVTFNLVEVARATGKIWTNAETITPKESVMNDAPYCAFCIPFGDVEVKATGRHDVNIFKEQSLGAINLLSYVLQSGKFLYDVQLLPYCPILNSNELYMDGEIIRYDNVASERVITFYSTDGSTFTADNAHAISKAFLFFSSSFSFNIEHSIPDKATALEKKIANCTEMYRLVSPNYSSYFEFSPYENNGVSKFNVDCTYKPYKSYIHINPDFAGLFGNDYNDNRGLVVTSDFSIPQVNDAWQSYQISNKNYSQIFERQIQNMKFNNRWSTAESIFGALTGSITGGISGGLTGGVVGNVVGGALIGGVASAAGGAVDIAKTLSTQREALDYTKDMYNYNLQNIQALPNSLASVSSFDANNKLFPFIEKYDCTDIEKEALRNKLNYNGWKIGRIGKLSDFIIEGQLTYIKCKLIRLDDSNYENNQINALAIELDKGVFI